MLEITRDRKPLDNSLYIGRSPNESEFGQFINEPSIIKNSAGQVEAVYLFLPESTVAAVRHIAKNVKMAKAVRVASGVATQSAVFGTMPRVPLRADYCRFTAQSRTNLRYFAEITALNKAVGKLYSDYLPQQHTAAMEHIVKSVEKDWRYVETPWLTANINVNHAIKYHTDTGNMDTFSNVLILKENMEGGLLVCPEYGVTFSQEDRALLFFNGKAVLHGVTPVCKKQENGYRASIVFYTLAGMTNCFCRAEETKRQKENRTKKEQVSTAERKENFLKAVGGWAKKLGVEI